MCTSRFPQISEVREATGSSVVGVSVCWDYSAVKGRVHAALAPWRKTWGKPWGKRGENRKTHGKPMENP